MVKDTGKVTEAGSVTFPARDPMSVSPRSRQCTGLEAP